MNPGSWAAEAARRALTFALAHRRDRLAEQIQGMTSPDLRAVVEASGALHAAARSELARRPGPLR